MYPKRYVLPIFLFVIVWNAIAQNDQFIFHNISEENGLTKADQYTFFRDSKGFIWIGSEDGLLQFDGQQIKKYQHQTDSLNTISENFVTSTCFEDSTSNLWFTTQGAINCYRRKSNDFVTYKLDSDLKNYHAFYFEQNQLWLRIGSNKEGALYKFNIHTSEFKLGIPLEGEECKVIKDKNGRIVQILSTGLPKEPGAKLKNLVNNSIQHIDFQLTTDGRKRTFPSPTKGSLVTNNGTVWVGVYNGLGKFQIGDTIGLVETKRLEHIDEDVGWISDIIQLNDQNLLLAATNGLLIFDLSSQKIIQQFRPKNLNVNSLFVKQPNRLFLDSNNTIWIGGSQQEIAFTNLEKNRFPYLNESKENFITCITEDTDGNIWCSTLDSGTYVYNQNKELLFRSTEFKNSTSESGYSDLAPLYFFLKNNKNEWWGNIGDNYLRWNPLSKKFEFKLSYFLGGISNTDEINYNYQLSNGKKLIAKGNTIYELAISKEKVNTLPWHNLQYLQLSTIVIIYEDQNKNIYLGDDQGRVVVLQEQNDQLKKLADYKDIGIVYAFKEDVINKLIWMTSSKGLGKINPTTFDYELLNEKNHNLPNEVFYSIAIDANNYLWLASNNGLVRYQPASKSFHRFGEADGLLSPIFNQNTCITASQTGEIWLGGKKGVNVFKPEDIQLLDAKPNVVLSRFLVNDEEYKSDGNINEQSELSFKYEDNTLSFEFVALDYCDPTANTFSCQMEGHDKDTIELGTRNFIRYGNLPIGDYTFKVWASNSDGVQNEVPLEMSIIIIPPFYRTWWFYLLCLLAISAIIYGVFQYRLEQALKVERLRVKISSDLHDDVGGLLSGLAMQTEVLELTAEESIKPKLQRIAELSRSAMSRMRDTVWAIDARKDKLENLIDRMNEHAEETLSPKDFYYEIETKNLDLKTNIPTDVRQNVYLIYKEAITNVAKHSNGDRVEVLLRQNNGRFEMSIHDNGKVKEKQYKTTGLGQSNMQMRAEQLGASLITNPSDDGFKVVLRMKAISF